MVATMKKWTAAFALAVVLLGSMTGWALHVNAATLQQHGSPTTRIVKPYCPPPPFDCLG